MDIMDGHFAPDFGFNVRSVREARALSGLPVDVHLMVMEPDGFIDRFAAEDISCLFIHPEAAGDTFACLRHIRRLGRHAGLAVSPETKPEEVTRYFAFCDEILVMTVKPGDGGGTVDEACIDKIKTIRDISNEAGYPLSIAVDGGIDLTRARRCVTNGADKIIAGTAFFRSIDPKQFCRAIKDE
jgi:ribulose-phosphate 3-epimerase